VASFRQPGPLGIDAAALPENGTLARIRSWPPGTIGRDAPGFRGGAVRGRLAHGKTTGTGSADAAAERARVERTAADPRRLAQDEAIGALPNKSDDFNFQGRIYRVVRDTDWRQLADSDRYQLIPREEARSTIKAMMLNLAVSMAHRAAFQAVLELIGDPNRGPSQSGLVLLRVVPTLLVKTAKAAAITPSQLKALQEKSQKTQWISIQLVDDAGNLVTGEPYVITTPDNVEYSGTTDESGIGLLDGIIAGQCKICFPNRDRDAWS
jgi:hypothetical protein